MPAVRCGAADVVDRRGSLGAEPAEALGRRRAWPVRLFPASILEETAREILGSLGAQDGRPHRAHGQAHPAPDSVHDQREVGDRDHHGVAGPGFQKGLGGAGWIPLGGHHLTLFDDMSSWLSVGASKAWVDMVVRPFVSDSTVALIELINEKPWPTDTAGIAWAKALIPHIQQVDGGIPVAVSIPLNDADPYAYWIGTLKSALAPVAPDVWDIHYYGLASLAKETFTSSKAVTRGRSVGWPTTSTKKR